MWIKQLLDSYFELIFWISGMICLAFANPADHAHFTLCPLKLMGVNWCPGCGLGHAISYLFHGYVIKSFHEHWLGIPALTGIFYRIYRLINPVVYFPCTQQ